MAKVGLRGAIVVPIAKRRWSGRVSRGRGIHYPIAAEQDIMGRYFTIGIKANL